MNPNLIRYDISKFLANKKNRAAYSINKNW
jgi:hypothetical protein